jgi:hypothetical protein
MRTAEDIMLLVRLFFQTERVVWLPDTVYHWVKHETSLSTTRYTFEHYADYLRCVDTFYEEAEKNRAIDLADWFCDDYLSSYLQHCALQCVNGHSTEEDASRLMALADDICARHKTFERFPDDSGNIALYPGLSTLRHALKDTSPSMLQRLANAFNAAREQFTAAPYAEVRRNSVQLPVRPDSYDIRQRLLRVRYQFCGELPEERLSHAGQPHEAAFAKTRLEYQGKDFAVFERILWLPVPAVPDGLLELHLNGQPAGLRHAPEEVRRAFAATPPDERALPVEARVLRKFAASPAASRFQDAWLFMDRDTQADDNAEHLYRWVTEQHPEINAWFVLSGDSHDWPRLTAEGFKLIAHGSMEHKALFLLCKNLISSQMDNYIFAPLEEEYYADLREAKFICLQHGVIKDDLSPWLNPIPMDVFVVTTQDEYASIVNDGTAYVMTAKEVCLSGQPRYDALMAPGEKEHIILAMPTWRGDLVGAWDGKGQKRALNPDFYSSPYVALWRDFFADPRLKALVDAHGYRLVFFAHPCLEDYLSGMPFPGFVEKRSKAQGSLQAVMKQSSLMITDFTSAAFDMAYMKRPVLYYQPESKESYAKRQNWGKGYLDYQTMGFGPVCTNRDELLAALENFLRSDCAMPVLYEARVDAAFPWRDGNCCRRIFESIMSGSRPFPAKNSNASFDQGHTA